MKVFQPFSNSNVKSNSTSPYSPSGSKLPRVVYTGTIPCFAERCLGATRTARLLPSPTAAQLCAMFRQGGLANAGLLQQRLSASYPSILLPALPYPSSDPKYSSLNNYSLRFANIYTTPIPPRKPKPRTYANGQSPYIVSVALDFIAEVRGVFRLRSGSARSECLGLQSQCRFLPLQLQRDAFHWLQPADHFRLPGGV